MVRWIGSSGTTLERPSGFGSAGIFPEHRARAEIVTRVCGPGRRVLELGAGAVGTAAAMADLGHEVVALELSPVRAAQARDLAREREGRLRVLEVDFYTVDLDGRFDVVCYWDGFGIGTDTDQRRLLRRVAGEWLKDDGAMLLDVFSPWAWLNRAGHEERLDRIWRLVEDQVGPVDLEVPVKVRYGFDTVRCRFTDEHWPVRRRSQAIKQTIRCYTPPDLLLLLEGTGLRIDALEVDGKKFTLEAESDLSERLADVDSYLAKLVRS